MVTTNYVSAFRKSDGNKVEFDRLDAACTVSNDCCDPPLREGERTTFGRFELE